MSDLHTATIIADVDLLDTVEFPVRKSAATGLLRGTFAKLKTYLKAGLKMTDFSDVDISTPPTDGQALIWNSIASKFKPGAAGGGGGGGGGAGTVNPSVIQYASAVGANGSVTFGAAPTPGNMLVAIGTHWTSNIAASAGWTQLVSSNGSTDGTIIATKVVTADDTATVSPWGSVNSTNITVFEVANWNGSTFQPFSYKQETAGTALTVNFGVPITGSLLVGASSTLSANAAPSSITGAGTVGTTTTGTTASASPRQITPFYSAGLTKGAKAITANYAVSASQYLSGVVICPDQVGSTNPWYWSPPGASAFTLSNGGGAANMVLTDDTDSGLIFEPTSFAAGGVLSHCFALQNLASPTADWTMTARLEGSPNGTFEYNGFGLCLYESSTNKFITHFFRTYSSNPSIAVCYWNSATSFNSDQRTMTNTMYRWLRVVHTGGNYIFKISVSGKRWITILTVSDTAFLAGRADKVGFVMGSARATDIYWQYACQNYSVA